MADSRFEFQYGIRNVAATRFNGERTCGEEEPENQRIWHPCPADGLLVLTAEIAELRSDIIDVMTDVTQILSQIESGDRDAAEQLLPLVYDELRKLAAARLANEKPGQTLQATALVHEAYLRLVGSSEPQKWDGRRHFFAAAAEAMRRILVDNARRKKSDQHGGDLVRCAIEPDQFAARSQRDPIEILAIHEALEGLARKSPRTAELVKLRYFMGCTLAEAAPILGVAAATAEEDWTYARAWLRREWLRNEKKSTAD